MGALVLLVFFAAPTAALVALAGPMPYVLDLTMYLVATAYIVTAALMLLEVRSGLDRRAPDPAIDTGEARKRLVTLLVAAYLPNERDVILDTVQHLTTQLDHPSYRTEVILAYNTPEAMPELEAQLRELSAFNASFTAVRIEGSTSKAQNIVGGLEHARGEVTAVLDADHHLHHDAISRALRWFDLNYDVVQGRCVVRNRRENRLTRLVTCEFEHIYAVMHAGRSQLFDAALFGGSNGFWRTDLLKRIGMDHTMLTEDIDSTLRATLAGARFVHDRSILSSELAPTTAKAWWNQRLRWAQGWLQVTLRHQRAVLASDVLTSTQKWCWTYLMSWREVFPVIASLAPAVIVASVVRGHGMHPGDPYLLLASIVTLASGLVSAYAAWRLATPATREEMGRAFFVYALATLPYTMLKNLVAMWGMVRESVGIRTWVVTTRSNVVRAVVGESG
jgi:cellulose synthase/poly-beta-1,6-N-acetylglucosamine synthase-like glycosyltransferase